MSKRKDETTPKVPSPTDEAKENKKPAVIYGNGSIRVDREEAIAYKWDDIKRLVNGKQKASSETIPYIPRTKDELRESVKELDALADKTWREGKHLEAVCIQELANNERAELDQDTEAATSPSQLQTESESTNHVCGEINSRNCPACVEAEPHENWCDCKIGLSESCNCMVGGYIERIAELEHQLSLPKVPQSAKIRALTKQILELTTQLKDSESKRTVLQTEVARLRMRLIELVEGDQP